MMRSQQNESGNNGTKSRLAKNASLASPGQQARRRWWSPARKTRVTTTSDARHIVQRGAGRQNDPSRAQTELLSHSRPSSHLHATGDRVPAFIYNLEEILAKSFCRRGDGDLTWHARCLGLEARHPNMPMIES